MVDLNPYHHVLPPNEAIQVSKRWQELLSSSVIYTAALQKYRIFPGRAICESLFVRYAKRRFSLEFGRPYSKAVYRLYKSESRYADTEPCRVAYCNRQVAWAEVDDDKRSLGVAVCHLQSGLIRRFIPQNRGRISHVSLSESLLAVITFEGYEILNVLRFRRSRLLHISMTQILHGVGTIH